MRWQRDITGLAMNKGGRKAFKNDAFRPPLQVDRTTCPRRGGREPELLLKSHDFLRLCAQISFDFKSEVCKSTTRQPGLRHQECFGCGLLCHTVQVVCPGQRFNIARSDRTSWHQKQPTCGARLFHLTNCFRCFLNMNIQKLFTVVASLGYCAQQHLIVSRVGE